MGEGRPSPMTPPSANGGGQVLPHDPLPLQMGEGRSSPMTPSHFLKELI